MDQSESPKKGESILDRVMSSQHAQAIEGFIPSDAFNNLLKGLTNKEQDILRRRFGLHANDPETLEEIGSAYHVTRERIRQIENGSVQKIRRAKQFRDTMAPIENLLTSILNAHGGLMEESAFFSEALAHAGNTADQRRALRFVLEELLGNRISYYPGDAKIKMSWKLNAQSLDLILQGIRELVAIVTRKNAPMTREELFEGFKKTELYRSHPTWFTDQTIASYTNLSRELARNPFGEYGLSTWGTIVPKRMNDKIMLVLKKHGKPLHFTEIAKHINEAGFDNRKAYPPTVHNELILNKQYVLIGRGIYALRDWGYKPGVVADVLIETLRNGKRAMTRDELISAVLSQRMVKRNTVLLALTNKNLFTRRPDGSYELAERK